VPNPAFLTSRLLSEAGFSHAFFLRAGGVSEGPYSSLNFSTSVGDTAQNVAENVRRSAAVLGVERERVFYLSQVHGRRVVRLSGGEDRGATTLEEADALVSHAAGHACGVRSADCVPILMADRKSGAVAAAHAGWRGVVAGVVCESLEALRELAGPDANIIAAIGPHISVDAFEVSEEVALELAAASHSAHAVRRDFGPKPHVDLRSIVRAQLEERGVRAGSIDDVIGCTVREPERFFSFRRDGKVGGRHLSAIVARG
jgi:polyphenol oxidase